MTVPIIPLNESTITLVNAFGFGASRLEHSIEQVGWLVKFSWDIEHLQEFLEQGYSPAVLINSKPDWYFYDENDRLNPWMQIDSAYLEGGNMKNYKAKLSARLRPAKFQIGEFVHTPDGEGMVLGIKYLTTENIEYLVQVINSEDEDIAASFAFWWTEDALR